MHSDLYIELFTVLTINLHPTLGIGSPGDPIKSFFQIDKCEEKWFVGSTVFLLQLAENKYCICGSSFMTWSVSLRPW